MMTTPIGAPAEAHSVLKYRVYRDPDALREILPEWEELVDASYSASIFSTWEWLGAWWNAFGAGKQLVVLAILDLRGRLVGLAPLQLSTVGAHFRVLQLLGDGSGDSDGLDLPVRPGFERDVARTFLDFLNTFDEYDCCQFNTMSAGSGVFFDLHQELTGAGWLTFEYQTPCSSITLPATWEAYLSRLSKRERKHHRARLKQIEERYRARAFKVSHKPELAKYLGDLFRLHQQRFRTLGRPGAFASAARRKFYLDLSRSLLDRNALEFWLLALDGQIVSAQYCFRYCDTVYALQSGFDPAFSSDRVGYVLRAMMLREFIGRGIRKFDFLGGVDEHKLSVGAEVGRYLDLHFARPHSRGAMLLRMVQGFRATKQWLHGHLPESGFALLRDMYRSVHKRTATRRQDAA